MHFKNYLMFILLFLSEAQVVNSMQQNEIEQKIAYEKEQLDSKFKHFCKEKNNQISTLVEEVRKELINQYSEEYLTDFINNCSKYLPQFFYQHELRTIEELIPNLYSKIQQIDRDMIINILDDIKKYLNNEKLIKFLATEYLSHIIIDTKDIKLVHDLIEKFSANVNGVYSAGYTNIFRIIYNNQSLEILKLLLENGLNTNQIMMTEFDEQTPLQYAAEERLADIVQELVKYKADVNYTSWNNYGRTPLIIAILKPNQMSLFKKDETEINSEVAKIVNTLLLSGADPEIRDYFGKNFYDYAKDDFIIKTILKQLKSKKIEDILDATNFNKQLADIITSYIDNKRE